MRIAFDTLSLAGFKSFSRPARVALATPGLVYLAGRNDVEPALGANGAGKSTLFEALYWVLFGKTSRNLRASDISSWDRLFGNAEVTLQLTTDKPHTLRRTWNPNTLELDGAPIDQQQLESVIGYTPSTFLYSVFHSQFGDYFADLQPAAQLAIYTDVLTLDLWEEASGLASQSASYLEKMVQAQEVSFAGCRGQLQEVRREVDALEIKECDWYRHQLRELKLRWFLVGKLEEVIAVRKRKLRILQAPRRVDEKLEQAKRKVEQLDVEGQDAQLRINELKSSQANLERAANNVKGKTRCPTCFQIVDQDKIRAHVQKESERIAAALIDARATLQKVAKPRGVLQQWINAAEAQLAQEEKIQRKAEGTVEAELRGSEEELTHVRSEIKKLAAAVCPFEPPRALQQQLEQKVATYLNSLQQLRQEVAANLYWVKAFREIRLSLIQTSLAQFEIVTNNALRALGLQEWAIEYGVESESKDGKLKRGFSISVRSPYNSDPVPFAAWSGGESQRLRLAVAIGLADLIQDFAGHACNLEIFDEPTAHLSAHGVDDLLAALAQRAESRNTSLWLADHHALEFGAFARLVTVVKTKEGSIIE